MKKVIVHLNCHTHPVASALADVLPDKEYDIIKVINFKKEIISEHLLKNCSIYIYQQLEGEHWGSYTTEVFLKMLPRSCVAVRYPILRFNPLWPFNTKSAFKTNSGELRKSVLFPDGDNYLVSMLDKSNDAEFIAKKYLELDLNTVTDLDSELQKIVDWYNNSRNSKDIKVGEFILSHFRDKRLFHTVDHISYELLNYMIGSLFELLGLDKNKQYRCNFMEKENIPIHPSVVRHFELSYVDEMTTYLYGGANVTAEEYYVKYVKELLGLNS